MTVLRLIPATVLAILLAAGLSAGESPAEKWQARIDREQQGDLDPADFSILWSLHLYNGKCQVHMIYDPKFIGDLKTNFGELKITFVRDGKDILSIDGHFYSVFRAHEDLLYFAEYDPIGSGCEVAAYDLGTGRKVWRTELKGIGPVAHSAYRNRVTMELLDDVIRVQGYEGAGDYVEILDKKTGKTLANRTFPQREPKGGGN